MLLLRLGTIILSTFPVLGASLRAGHSAYRGVTDIVRGFGSIHIVIAGSSLPREGYRAGETRRGRENNNRQKTQRPHSKHYSLFLHQLKSTI